MEVKQQLAKIKKKNIIRIVVESSRELYKQHININVLLDRFTGLSISITVLRRVLTRSLVNPSVGRHIALLLRAQNSCS